MNFENVPVLQWLSENWLLLALILSELAAFMPAKAKGIVHFIVKVGSSLFKKKNVQS
jgi:hypothetical protein